MHRSLRGTAVTALALISLVAAPAALAQDPATTAGHPLVGAWLVDVNVDDTSDPPVRVSFSSDGTLIQVSPTGAAVGVWEPTGERTGALAITGENADDAGALSKGTIRATVEVAEDGQSWTAQATGEYIGPDGVPSGQVGPVTATATRILVEPMSPAAATTGVVASAQIADTDVASAALQDANGAAVGTVTWTQGDGVVTVTVSVEGMPVGFHGFHVHQVGECVAPFTSAGGHLNPAGASHPDHAADQPVLLVNADGTGAATFTTDRYAVADLAGAAVIVHANPDNYANIPERYLAPGPSASPVASAEPVMVAGPDAATRATGDAGPRIACGVIESGAVAVQ